jgi:hypothetical protein
LKKRKGIGKLMLVKLLKKIVNKKLGTREISDEAVPQKEMPSTYELFAELLASEETSQTEVLIRVSSS